MRYLPQTPEEIKKMCAAVGVSSPDALFDVIPQNLRLQQDLDLPAPLAEAPLLAHLKGLGRVNANVDSMAAFLGGGAYHHYIPVLVSTLTSRGEYLTSYTPYQPEISQGTLQAIFEFQTMIASLTGMDLANASNYDGASALAEAALMALRITRRQKILVSTATNPQYREVLHTYLKNRDFEIEEIALQPDGRVDLSDLQSRLKGDVAAVCLQSPNAFGVIEATQAVAQLAHDNGSLMVGCFSEALSLGLLKPFGEVGADIVVGEGQSFGNFLNLGGPYLGLFATKEKYVRQMPGRLVGETLDANGKRGFVLVLSTREQHIRREKATSNICTNQGLCALATVVYLSLMGPKGLERLAQINFSYARFLRDQLTAIPGVTLKFTAPHFNEFVLQVPGEPKALLAELAAKGILGGVDVSQWAPGLENGILVCATEMNTKDQMEQYAQALREVLA